VEHPSEEPGDDVLASSGERRLHAVRQRLVLDLYERRGDVWAGVSEFRRRWDIEASRGLPAPLASEDGRCYEPAGLWGGGPAFRLEEGSGESGWQRYVELSELGRLMPQRESGWQWYAELSELHDRIVPRQGRLASMSTVRWGAFLSACVMYDPKVPGLPEFARVGAAALKPDRVLPECAGGKRTGSEDRGMVQAPIVYLKDADRSAEIVGNYYQDVIAHIIDKYLVPRGFDPVEVLDDLAFRRSPEMRRIFDRRVQAERENERRPYIEVSPHNTERDVQSAFRMLASKQEERPKTGRPGRDLLLDAECAILKDRFEWSVEQIAEEYGWESTRPTKPIKEGRRILKALSETG